MVKSNLRIQVLGLVLIMATTVLTGCKGSNHTTIILRVAECTKNLTESVINFTM